jgi:hypothetical protein
MTTSRWYGASQIRKEFPYDEWLLLQVVDGILAKEPGKLLGKFVKWSEVTQGFREVRFAVL